MGIIKTTYKDQVIDYVYNLILKGELNPGDQVKESHLSVEMGISRAPIREALKELIADGIIEYRPQVGNFVYKLSPKEIVDAYTTRGVLEGFAVQESHLLFTEDEVDELETMAEVMEMYAVKGNNKKVTDIGGEFHDMLVERNQNTQLNRFSRGLSLKLHILFYKHWGKLYSPTEIKDRHMEIVDSIKQKNPGLIENVIRDHYIETGQKIAALQQDSVKV